VQPLTRGFIHRWKRPCLGPMDRRMPRLSHLESELEGQENLRFALSLIDRGTGFLSMTSKKAGTAEVSLSLLAYSGEHRRPARPPCHDRQPIAPPRCQVHPEGVFTTRKSLLGLLPTSDRYAPAADYTAIATSPKPRHLYSSSGLKGHQARQESPPAK
jgi:hypothetical protein